MQTYGGCKCSSPELSLWSCRERNWCSEFSVILGFVFFQDRTEEQESILTQCLHMCRASCSTLAPVGRGRAVLCKWARRGVSAIQVVSHPLLCLKTTELQLLPLSTSFFLVAIHQLSLCCTCVHIYRCIYSHRLGANKMLIYYGLKSAYFIRWQYSTLSVVPGQPSLLPFSLRKAFHCLCLGTGWGGGTGCR